MYYLLLKTQGNVSLAFLQRYVKCEKGDNKREILTFIACLPAGTSHFSQRNTTIINSALVKQQECKRLFSLLPCLRFILKSFLGFLHLFHALLPFALGFRLFLI